jgi:hypothetical protein
MIRNIFKTAAPLITAAGLCLAVPAPVLAQASSYTPGDYWDVSMVEVTSGQFETYTDWLAGEWKKNQEFAKSKGWISDYHVLYNTYKRAGEADIYILTRYKQVYSPAEQIAQQKEYEAFVKKDSRRIEQESGARGSFRKLVGSTQFQEVVLK